MSRIISISGAHNVGKTTLLKHIKENTDLQVVESIKNRVLRFSLEAGINVVTGNNDDYQLMCAFYMIENHLKLKNNTVSDRSILDILVYSIYLNKVGRLSDEVFDIIEKLYEKYIVKFTRIIYIEPVLGINEKTITKEKKEYRQEIADIFNQVLVLNSSLPKVYRINKTTYEQRVNQLKQYII